MYQFVCGDGNTPSMPKTVDTSPEIQSNVPVSQGAATVSGSSQTQTKPVAPATK
jgi:hypothetical protein